VNCGVTAVEGENNDNSQQQDGHWIIQHSTAQHSIAQHGTVEEDRRSK